MKTVRLVFLVSAVVIYLAMEAPGGRGGMLMALRGVAAQSDSEVAAALSACMKTAPPTAPASTGSSITPGAAQLALQFHNCARQEVGSPPLQWSPELSGYAQRWADHLAKTQGCNLVHSQGDKYGENLFGGSEGYTPLFASQDWYTEKKLFHYGVLTESNWAPAGHYTQMVWKSTTTVGMGEAHCADGKLVVAAEYAPPGNMMGEKPY